MSELKSWLWIPAIWIVVYSLMLVVGIALGNMFSPIFYWWAMLFGVPLTIAPVTYKSLVGGGCSLRFQICALVKGTFAGVVFLILTMIADSLLWPNLALSVGWNPTSFSTSELFYQIWFFSGIIGGIGARIVEVRGYTASSEIVIAGFE
ncbi:MAG: hypothetical protein ACXAC0_03875 [Candidatus Thorarchaeota archaeon]